MSTDHSPRIFILGSCVSRDALEQEPGRFELVNYLARTSMASIGMPMVEDEKVRRKVAEIASPFQQRMLLNDLDKTTMSLIKTTPHDILLLDFVDERFNLLLSGRSLFSFSGELEKSGVEAEERVVVTPDSESFLSLWLAGLGRLLSDVDTTKVVLNRVYWAERFPDGSDASSRGWIQRSNAVLQRLYDAADQYWTLRRIDYPREIVVADPHHKWGVAPYHYTTEFYAHTIAALEQMAFRGNGVG
jgi:hypothetical protein